MAVTLEVFALHELVTQRGERSSVNRIGAAALASLPPEAQSRLRGYLDDVRLRPELEGKAVPAWWTGPGPPKVLADAMTCPLDSFDDVTFAAAQRLAQLAKGNAVGGLVVFLRGQDDGEPVLGCVKLELKTIEDVALDRGRPAGQALRAVDVADVLPRPRSLQKAALIPPPVQGADLWVVEDQLESTAAYWLGFLGAEGHPGEKPRLRLAAAALERTLVEDFSVRDPRPAIDAAYAALVHAPSERVLPSDFIAAAAAVEDLDEDELVDRVGRADARIADEHFVLTQRAARKTGTRVDLGDGVEIRGPRGDVRERVSRPYEKDGDRYVEVRLTDGPTFRDT